MKYLYISILLIIGTTLIGVISCNTDDFSVTAINITASESEIIAENIFTFTVNANNGDDITTETSFKVDGVSIAGNSFTSDSEPKTYSVQAFYNDIESNVIEVSTVAAGSYVKNVLVEDYTGIWCGWCPRVSYAIHLAKENETHGEKVIAVAIHMSEGGETDLFSSDYSTTLRNAFTADASGLPQGKINRINTWTADENENLDEVYNSTGYSSIGVAIDSETETGTINGTINVNFLEDYSSDTNIVIYLIENKLIHDQHNYTVDMWSSGNDDPLVNFEHNDVLRAVYTNIYGEAIPSGEQIAGNTYSYAFSGTIPSSVENNENLLLIAFVVNADTNEVLNVRESHLGENQDFQVGEEE